MKIYHLDKYTQFADDKIKSFISTAGNSQKFIYVVPTRRKQFELQKQFVKQSSDSTSEKYNIFTIETLFEKIYKSKNADSNKISESLSFVLIQKIIKRCKLKYFVRNRERIPISIIELLINIVNKFREVGFNAKSIKEELNKVEGYNKIKLEDIFIIASEYEKYFDSLNVYDIGKLYNYFTKMDDDKFKVLINDYFPNLELIFIDGFSDFSNLELQLLKRTASVSDKEIQISLDFVDTNENLFFNQVQLEKEFIKLGFKSVEIQRETDRKKEIIGHNLFNNSKKLEKYENKTIEFIESFTKRDEIENIARKIKELSFYDQNFNLCESVILINNIEEYSDLLREVFEEYEIPCNISDRFYLRNSAIVIQIINLLKLIRDDFYNVDFEKFVDSFTFNIGFINKLKLKKFIIEENIIGSKDNFLKKINSKVKYYKYRLMQDVSDEYLLELLNEYELLRDGLVKLFRLTEEIKSNLTPKEFVEKFSKLISFLGIEDYLFSLIKKDINNEKFVRIESKELKAYNNFMEILDELITIHHAMGEDDVTFSLNYYYEYLIYAISGNRFNISTKLSNGILITHPEEIRNIKCDYIFLAGLINGNFPRKNLSVLYFADKYFQDEFKNLTSERYLFYQIMNSYREKIFLSYYTNDDKKKVQKSDFIIELQKIISVENKNKDENVILIYKKRELLQFKLSEELKRSSFKSELKSEFINIEQRKRRYYSRKKNEGDNNYSGQLQNVGVLLKLQNSLPEKIHNITELQKYIYCPFMYFVDIYLNISELEEREESVSLKNKGLLLHTILKKYFNYIKNNNINFYEILNSDFDGQYRKLREITINEIENEYGETNEKYFLYNYFLSNGDYNNILYKFLEAERNDERPKIKPSEFEKRIENKIKTENDEIRIRGIVDRIDYDGRLRVIDYKTGNPFVHDNLVALKILQLPYYLAYLKEYYIKESKEIKGYDCENIYFENDYPKIEIKIKSYREILHGKKVENFDEFLDKINSKIIEILNSIKSGKYNLTENPDDQKPPCRYCDYSAICRRNFIN